MVEWDVICATMQGVVSLSHTLVVLFFFYSAHDTFDVLTQACILKVLEPLLLYILENFRKADTDLQLS